MIGIGWLIRNWRIGLYASIGLAITVAGALIRASGKKFAKQKQMRDWLKSQQQRNRDAKAIQRMPDSDVRERLRKRWSV